MDSFCGVISGVIAPVTVINPGISPTGSAHIQVKEMCVFHGRPESLFRNGRSFQDNSFPYDFVVSFYPIRSWQKIGSSPMRAPAGGAAYNES